MSAFIVNDYHINALVSYGVANNAQYYKHGFGWFRLVEHPEVAAQLLHKENVRSVNHRYGQRTRAKIEYRQVNTGHLSAADVIRACDCLRYQSCERKDWDRSAADLILTAIRERAIDALATCSDVWELRQPLQVAA